MSAWIASVRALPMTFLIYVIEATLAMLAALPLAREVAVHAPFGNDPTAHAAWLEFGVRMLAPARVGGLSALLCVALLWLISPWLQMAWLSALAQQESAGTSLSHGARLWLRALLVGLWVGLGSILFLAPFAGIAWGMSQLSASRLNDRVHDLGVVCALLPAVPVVLACLTWLDLARARALREGAWHSALRSLRVAVRPAVILRAVAWHGAGWLLYIVSHALPLLPLRTPATMLVLQVGVLARLFFRSRWLADALTCVEASPTSGEDQEWNEDVA